MRFVMLVLALFLVGYAVDAGRYGGRYLRATSEVAAFAVHHFK